MTVVKAFAQDRSGWVWIGTVDGLNHFNGSDFVELGNRPEDPTSLSNNSVSSLLVDSGGRLWVGTWGGLNLYDHRTRTFRRWLHDPRDPGSLPDDYVEALTEGKDQMVWVGTRRGFDHR